MARWWLSTEAGQRCSQRVLSVWNNGVAMKPIVSALLYAALATGLWAEVRLPALFGDHMVIQRDLPVHVWGWADPGEAVKVEFLDQQASTTAPEDGRWETYLEPARPGGPYSLEVRGANAIMIKDIHVGEVWVGSGQSNMVWPLRRSRDAEKEIASANYPGIRYFKVELDTSDTPQEDVRGEWRVVTPETAPELSGVAYFFARNLREKLELPLGIIQSAWGGTPAEAWTSLQTLSADHSLAGMVGEFEREAKAAKGAYDTSLANWEQRAAKAKSQGKDLPRKPPPPRAGPPTPTKARRSLQRDGRASDALSDPRNDLVPRREQRQPGPRAALPAAVPIHDRRLAARMGLGGVSVPLRTACQLRSCPTTEHLARIARGASLGSGLSPNGHGSDNRHR